MDLVKLAKIPRYQWHQAAAEEKYRSISLSIHITVLVMRVHAVVSLCTMIMSM
jgi:hypothetical protein